MLLTLGFYEAKKAIDNNTNIKASIARLENKAIETDLMLNAMRKDFADLESNLGGMQCSLSQDLASLKSVLEQCTS